MTEYLDRPPTGWFVLSVMRTKSCGWDWVALMIDINPDADEFEKRALLDPGHSCWVRIAGKHKSSASAHDALVDMRATRH